MAKLIILVGLPSSGKSTYIEKNFCEGFEILSSDKIRKELFFDEQNQANNSLVFSSLYRRAKEFLSCGKSVVVDATNINRFERKRVLDNFTEFDIERIAIYIDTNINECIERDLKRARTVGDDIIMHYANKFEPPTKDEGFDEVIVIKNV